MVLTVAGATWDSACVENALRAVFHDAHLEVRRRLIEARSRSKGVPRGNGNDKPLGRGKGFGKDRKFTFAVDELDDLPEDWASAVAQEDDDPVEAKGDVDTILEEQEEELMDS